MAKSIFINEKDAKGSPVKIGRTKPKTKGILSSKERLIEHLDEFVDWNHEYQVKYFGEIIINFSVLIDNDILSDVLAEQLTKKVYNNQVETLWRIIKAITDNPGKHITVDSVTQVGKTGTQSLCYFIGPILWLLNPQVKKACITLLPNDTSLSEQTNQDFSGIWRVYSQFINLKKSNRSTTLGDYNSKIISQQIGWSYPNETVYRCCNGDEKKGFNLLYQNMTKMGINAIFIIDEPDHGASNTSIRKQFLENTGYYDYKNFSIDFSATIHPEVNPDDENRITVNHKVGNGYHGFLFKNGKSIDEEQENVKPLDITSISNLVDIWNIDKNIKNYKAKMYFDQGHYNDNQEDSISWPQYRKKIENAFVKLIRWALLECNPKNGQGFMIRLVANNSHTDEFIEQIKHRINKEIDIIKIYGDNINPSDFKNKILQQRSSDKKPYIVFVTASARRGNQVSDDIKYCLELSECSNDTAYNQAGKGRATGYKSGLPAMVILSDKMKAYHDLYIECKGDLKEMKLKEKLYGLNMPKPHPCVNWDTHKQESRKLKLFDIPHNRTSIKNKEIAKVYEQLAQLQDELNDAVKGVKKLRGSYFDIFQYIHFDLLEKHAHLFFEGLSPNSKIRLLRQGEYDHFPNKEPRKYLINENGWAKVGFRDSSKPAQSNSTKNKYKSDNSESPEENRKEVQVHFQKINGEFKVMAVKLSLANPEAGAKTCVSTEKSMYHPSHFAIKKAA